MKLRGQYDSHALTSVIKSGRPPVDGVFRRFHRSPPHELHHYTNGNTLLSILEHKQLWATHISCVNDSMELRHAWKVFLEACSERYPSGDSDSVLLLREFEKRLPDDPVSESGIFIACFSEADNDLAQWRAYGGDASGEDGYMITFDGPSVLARMGALHVYPKLVKVEYELAEQRSIMRDLADQAFTNFRQWGAYFKGNLSSDDWTADYATLWFGMMAEFAPCLKDPAFKREDEWRLIASYPSGAPCRSKLKFKQRSSMISRHLPLGNGSDPLPIRRVLVGPSRHKRISRESIEIALKEWGYTSEKLGWQVEVCESDTPVQAV